MIVKNLLCFVTLLAFVVSSFLATAQENAAVPNPAPPPAGEDPAYTRVIEGRTQAILDLLDLNNAAARVRVHDAVMAHYRLLNDWQNAHETRYKQLKKESSSADAATSADAKKAMEALRAPIEQGHKVFVTKLEADLSPAQVDKVKDKLTYNKVEVTYNGYCDMLPNLTAEQKTKILDWLKEAREIAIDGMSSEEKTAVFGKYKGRINNYLSKEGYDLKKASQEWNARLKARREARPQ